MMRKFVKNVVIGDSELVRLKAQGDGNGRVISGLATTFRAEGDAPDTDGDRLLPGALDSLDLTQIKPKMFFDHDQCGVPIGLWTDLQLVNTGLEVTGSLTEGVSQAEDVWAALKAGTLNHLSIHMTSDQYTITDTGYNILNVTGIPEISVVNYPADTQATIDVSVIKSALADAGKLNDYEAVLRESAGFSKKAAVAFVSGVKACVTQGDPVARGDDELLQKLKSFSLTT